MSIRLTNILPAEARVLVLALSNFAKTTDVPTDATLASDMASVVEDQLRNAP